MGEGTKYAWGGAKKYYRRIPYHDKQSFVAFVDCVKSCLSKVNLTMLRRFSDKVRACILPYYYQAKEQETKERMVKKESCYKYNEKNTESVSLTPRHRDHQLYIYFGRY